MTNYDNNEARENEPRENEHRENEPRENEPIENADIYICICGCGLKFINYETGLDIYVENSWIITQNAMVEYDWNSFIPRHEHKIWQELKDYIIKKYKDNEVIHRGPFIHLYNYHVDVENDPIPLNGKLYYEHGF